MMRGLMEQQKTCEFYAEHIGKFDPRCLLALLPFLGQPYRNSSSTKCVVVGQCGGSIIGNPLGGSLR